MGYRAFGKSYSSKAWNTKKSWKKDGFKKDYKSKYDKFKKHSDDDCGPSFDWKKSFKKKDWKKDFKKDWKSDWKFEWKGWKKDGHDNGHDCKVDWKGCKIDWSIKRGDCKTDWGKCRDGDKKNYDCKIDLHVCDLRPPKPDCEEPELPEPPVEQANRAPVITGPVDDTIDIGRADVGDIVARVTAEDPDVNDTLVFRILDATDPDSPDADMFLIDPETGVVTLKEDGGPFGSANGDASYLIEVEVEDSGNLTDTIELEFTYFTAA